MLAERFLGALNDLRENAGDRSSLAIRQDGEVSTPEQKYIGGAGGKAPNWGPFLQASGLGRIIHRGVSTGAA
jgi:hypothetical protein